MCDISRELECDEDTLTKMITTDNDISLVSSSGIYQVNKNNDDFIRFLYAERKKIIKQSICLNKGEKQWKLL